MLSILNGKQLKLFKSGCFLIHGQLWSSKNVWIWDIAPQQILHTHFYNNHHIIRLGCTILPTIWNACTNKVFRILVVDSYSYSTANYLKNKKSLLNSNKIHKNFCNIIFIAILIGSIFKNVVDLVRFCSQQQFKI